MVSLLCLRGSYARLACCSFAWLFNTDSPVCTSTDSFQFQLHCSSCLTCFCLALHQTAQSSSATLVAWFNLILNRIILGAADYELTLRNSVSFLLTLLLTRATAWKLKVKTKSQTVTALSVDLPVPSPKAQPEVVSGGPAVILSGSWKYFSVMWRVG